MTSTTDRSAPVVLVVGASSGIGRETALRYARRGARLALAARSPAALRHVAATCAAAGAVEVFVRTTDIADREQVDALVEETVHRWGRLDITVQSAAVTAFGRFDEVPPDVFDAVLRTNVVGTANVARSVLRRYRTRGRGVLVLVGSALGLAAIPFQPAYIMSKFAITGFVRVLRQENRDRPGITVHGIYPGAVDTPIYTRAANYTGWTATPPPPVATAATVATAIVRAAEGRRSTDRSVGLANGALVLAFRLIPTVFDAVVAPLVRLVGFTDRPVEPTTGNVFPPASTVVDLDEPEQTGAPR